MSENEAMLALLEWLQGDLRSRCLRYATADLPELRWIQRRTKGNSPRWPGKVITLQSGGWSMFP